ncbi:helix-turn-helix domain-containing protein [Nonomuraea sp. NPDC049152]|uniref:helix-turn-helix domain-containing protein n=1 Tax=Nonomuraea sp. NPDC049152 TaxID=3154350 RepID=UPI0033EFF2D8
MRTAYKVPVYPAEQQAAVLNRTFGCVRLVWNRVLSGETPQARLGSLPHHPAARRKREERHRQPRRRALVHQLPRRGRDHPA